MVCVITRQVFVLKVSALFPTVADWTDGVIRQVLVVIIWFDPGSSSYCSAFIVSALQRRKTDERLGVNWPVATERTSTVLSLMMGLKICLVSAVPARFLLWHFRIRRSSCFCRRTRMSSKRSVYSSARKRRIFVFTLWAEAISKLFADQTLTTCWLQTNRLVLVHFPRQWSLVHHCFLG